MDRQPTNALQTPEEAAEALYGGNAAQPVPIRRPPMPPNDPIETGEQAVAALYNKQPLPVRPGELHGSFAAMQAQLRSAEVYEKTGEQLDLDEYRVYDVFPAKLGKMLVDGHIDNLLANARVLDNGEAEAEDLALEQQAFANMEENRRRAVAQYGPRDGEDLINRTIAWARTQPFAPMLRERFLGTRPDIAEELIHYVFTNAIR